MAAEAQGRGVNVAWSMPAIPLRVPDPSTLASRKRTVPVGVPPAGELTVAVKVTGWPAEDGLAEEVRLVDVVDWETVWVKAADVLPL